MANEGGAVAGLCICLLACILFAGSIVLLVFQIMSLTEVTNAQVVAVCPESKLWTWMIVMLVCGIVLQCVNGQSSRNRGEEKKASPLMLVALLINIAIWGWGAYEVWGVDCAILIKQKGWYLWPVSQVVLIVQAVMYGIFILLACCAASLGLARTGVSD